MSDTHETSHEPGHRPTLPERVEEIEHRVEEKVEAAVENIAEGVAEHVPPAVREKVRWTVRKLVLVIGGTALLAIVLAGAIFAWYVWNHTEWAAHELTGRVNSVLLARSDVKLSIQRLRGNPLQSVIAYEPRITFRDDNVVLLTARSMRLRYSTWDLLTARKRAIVLELDHPVVNLTRGKDGKLRLPIWKAGPARPGTPNSYDFGIRIRDGDVIAPEDELSIVDFDLDAAAATGGTTRLDVASLRWVRGPYGMRLDNLRGGIQVDDSVGVEIRELESPEIALSVRGRWARGGPRQLEGEVGHVRWAWLAKAFRNGTLDVPGEGGFAFAAHENGGWSGSLTGRGVWSDLPFDARGGFQWRDNRFTMDRLQGVTPAGVIADGRLAWAKEGWDVGGRASEANPARWSALGLKNWPAGRLSGTFHYAVDTRRPERPSRLDAHLSTSEWAGWHADSGVVRVEFPAAGPDTFGVLAWRRGGQLNLLGRVEGGGWHGRYQVKDFPLEEWPDGRATGLRGVLSSGAGTVEAKDGGLFLTGALEGANTKWFGMDAGQWKLDDVKGRLLPTPELDARASLRNTFYLGLHFDSVGTPVHLGNQTLAMTNLEAWGGDTLVTMSAGADWDARGWRFVATRAEAKSRQFDWIAEPPLSISGNPQGTTFDRVVARDGESRLDVTGRWAVPGGSYDWRATARGLKLDRLGLPVDLGLGGTADAELVVTGPSGNPRWELEGIARAPAMRGHVADSLEMTIGGAPSRLDVRNLRLAVGGGTFSTAGAIEAITPAWPDTLTPNGIADWLAGADRWRVQARADSLPLASIARLANADAGWAGRLNLTADVSGRPAAPEFQLEARAHPMSWRNLRIDDVYTRATYADQKLRVTELRTTRDRSVSNVTGEMEIALGLGKKTEALDAPMRWKVDLPNGDLALIPVLVPQIGFATGRFEVRGDVTGTPRHPKLVGSARVRDGRLRLAGRAELLEDVRANIDMTDDGITVDSLTAVQRTGQGDAGRVRGSGVVRLRPGLGPTYEFSLSLRDFTAVEAGVYAARFDGDFRIVNGARVKGVVLPHVTSSNVEIRRGVVLYDFTRQTEQQMVQASTMPLFWTYQIQIHANDNLRWQPPDGNIEFSADLSLQQTPEKLIIFGDMDALRGTYYFLSNTFTLRRAKLTFDNVGGVDPVVDAEAFTRLIPTQVATSAIVGASTERNPSPHVITVRIQGRSSRPAIEFVDQPTAAGEPSLDQAQILQELTVGRFAPGQQVSLLDPFDSYLTRVISRQLSAELSQRFRGYLSDWEIARESSTGGGNYIVRVGSQLNDRVAVRYGQRLPGTGRGGTPITGSNATLIERDLEAEYRINRYFYITSQLTQRRNVVGSSTVPNTTPDFNVNLKARWEY